jgi:hypothetical protein
MIILCSVSCHGTQELGLVAWLELTYVHSTFALYVPGCV